MLKSSRLRFPSSLRHCELHVQAGGGVRGLGTGRNGRQSLSPPRASRRRGKLMKKFCSRRSLPLAVCQRAGTRRRSREDGHQGAAAAVPSAVGTSRSAPVSPPTIISAVSRSRTTRPRSTPISKAAIIPRPRTCNGTPASAATASTSRTAPAAEIDLYGGVRLTFDKLALDFGVMVLLLSGRPVLLRRPAHPTCNPLALPNGNVSNRTELPGILRQGDLQLHRQLQHGRRRAITPTTG